MTLPGFVNIEPSLSISPIYFPILGIAEENKALDEVHGRIKEFYEKNKSSSPIQEFIKGDHIKLGNLVQEKRSLHECGLVRNAVSLVIACLVASYFSIIGLAVTLYFLKSSYDEYRNIQKCYEREKELVGSTINADFLKNLGIQ